jgi:hypothetical protein
LLNAILFRFFPHLFIATFFFVSDPLSPHWFFLGG